jgi:hypothetical protein
VSDGRSVTNGVRAGGGRLPPAPRLSTARTASARPAPGESRAGSHPQRQAAEDDDGAQPRELGSWCELSAAGRPPAEPRGRGPYADAVARWEQLLGRRAPAPNQPGTHGKPVLAPPFVEWLMGLSIGSELEAGQHGKPFLQAKAGRSAWSWGPKTPRRP